MSKSKTWRQSHRHATHDTLIETVNRVLTKVCYLSTTIMKYDK